MKVVSNYEIELIDGGDNSELKAYVKDIWKALAEEHQEEYEVDESENENEIEQMAESVWFNLLIIYS